MVSPCLALVFGDKEAAEWTHCTSYTLGVQLWSCEALHVGDTSTDQCRVRGVSVWETHSTLWRWATNLQAHRPLQQPVVLTLSFWHALN